MHFILSAWRKPLVLLLALCLGGCDHGLRVRATAEPPEASRERREADMNSRWQERTFTELIRTLGPPRTIMKIPGGGNPPGFAVEYGRHPGTGCIDAFAVNTGLEPSVRAYYCR